MAGNRATARQTTPRARAIDRSRKYSVGVHNRQSTGYTYCRDNAPEFAADCRRLRFPQAGFLGRKCAGAAGHGCGAPRQASSLVWISTKPQSCAWGIESVRGHHSLRRPGRGGPRRTVYRAKPDLAVRRRARDGVVLTLLLSALIMAGENGGRAPQKPSDRLLCGRGY